MPTYAAIFDGPARNYRRDKDGDPVLSRKKYITIHNTSNDATAEGEASYAKRRTDGTSSHYYVDNNSIVQSLNTDWCAGHVGSYQGNTYGISYEITGFNGWSRDRWLASVAWDLLAAQMARDCLHFGIPVRLLTIEQMRAGTVSGFITHDMARQAWGGTTHTDPGPNFPMDHLSALVRQRLGVTGEDDMTPEQAKQLHNLHEMIFWNVRPWLEAFIHATDAKLKAIAAKVDIDPAELDAIKAAAEAGAKAGIAQTLTPETIAAAIPDDVAEQVVELLAARLAG